MVSWANYVLLFPKVIKSEAITTLAGLNYLAESNNKRYSIYSKINASNETALALYDINSDNLKNVWPIESTTLVEPWLQNPQVLSVKLANNARAFLRLKKETSEEAVILDFSKPVPVYSYRLALAKYPITKVEWNPQNQNELIVIMNNNLYRLSLDSNSQITETLLDKNIIDFSVDNGGTIFYVQEVITGNVVAKTQPDGSNKSLVAESVEKSKSYQFAYSREKNILAVLPNDTRNLVVFDQSNGTKTSRQLDQKVLGMKWNKNGSRLAYFDGAQIGVYDFEKMAEKRLDLGTTINQLSWYFDENHLLIQGDNGLFVVDYDGFNKIMLSQKVSRVSIYNQASVYYSILTNGLESYNKIILNF